MIDAAHAKGPRAMFPSRDQIERAAYDRWSRRGRAHGRDRDDWLAAEQDLLFSLNYRVVARYRLDGDDRQVLGVADPRRCRFCERSAPRTTFSGTPPAVPPFMGNTSLFSLDECDECRAQFVDTIEVDLERFTRPYRDGAPARRPCVPVAAYKGFVKMAIAAMPARELPYFEDAIEWVGNPDHGLDRGSFRALACVVTPLAAPAPSSWLALARRADDEAPVPYMLAFAATGHAVFQVHLPLCARDEDLDGDRLIVPRVSAPFGPLHGPDDPAASVVPLGPSRPAPPPG